MPRTPGYSSYAPSLDGSEMTADECEFLLAVAGFQRRTGRRYPTWREILYIARCLGYRKTADPVPVDRPCPTPEGESTKFEVRSPKPDPGSTEA